MTYEKDGNTIVVQGDPDLEDLMPGYITHRVEDVKLMNEALVNNDYDTVRVLGHSMKGSGGGYGIDEITDIGRELEIFGTEKNDEELRKWIDELAYLLEYIEIVY